MRRVSEWLSPLQGDEERARSQSLLWAEEARLDFVVLPITVQQGTPVLDAETKALLRTLLAERKDALIRLKFAFAPTSMAGATPSSSRDFLEGLVQQYIEPAGAAYARACGRPLLFVDGSAPLGDPRFVVVRTSPPFSPAPNAAGH